MKIKTVILNNYGGYKFQKFDFVNGLNTIIGTGNSGKSKCLHGIDFVINNNQSHNYISNEIKDSKGKIKKGESCWVEIHLFDNSVIRRERTRTDNFYQINDCDPIRNFNQGVPDDVLKIFSMNEINIQNQFETHFLLNDNDSTKAKTLNKMAGLENIDESISNINKIVRQIKKHKDASDINLKKYNEEIGKFDFIEQMEKDIEDLFVVETKSNTLRQEQQELIIHLSTIRKLATELKTISDSTTHLDLTNEILDLYSTIEELDSQGYALTEVKNNIIAWEKELDTIIKTTIHEPTVDALLTLFDSKTEIVKEYNSLLDCVERIEGYEKSLQSYTDIDKCKGNVAEIISLFDKVEELDGEAKDLERMLSNIDLYEKTLKELDKSIKEDYLSIDGQDCPTCGQSMKYLKEVC